MKATYIGTVVAGTSQQEAIASYLETINGNHDNSKVVFGVSESSEKVFLTSVSNIAKPLSPLTGAQSCVAVMSDKDAITAKLSLMSDGEMVASGKFDLKAQTCPNCSSHLVSDNAELLAHCVVCGSEQDLEDEGEEESVDVSIIPDDEDEGDSESASGGEVSFKDVTEALAKVGIKTDVDTVEAWVEGDSANFDEKKVDKLDKDIQSYLGKSVYNKFMANARLLDKLYYELGLSQSDTSGGVSLASEDEMEVEGDLTVLVEAMQENGFSVDQGSLQALLNGESGEAVDGLKEQVIELMGEDQFNAAVADGSLEDALIDAILGDDEEDDDGESESSDSDEDEFEEDESEDDDESEDEESDEDSESCDSEDDGDDDIDEEVLASILASADDEEEAEEEDESDDDESDDDESDSCVESRAPNVTEDQNKGTIGAGNKVDADIEDMMEVDLLEDNIGASASLSSNKVQLVYHPSDNVGETKWYAIANGAPVAVATMHSVGEEKAGMFTTDAFRKGTEMLMTQMGVAEGLMGMGFKAMTIRMPVKNIVQSHVATATASVQAEAEARVSSISEDVRAALATAAVGINKGFFSQLTNPVKAEMYDVLSAAGVKNAEVLIDNAFATAADDYHRVLLAKAFDLMGKPVEARNEISQAVMTASYQRAGGSEGASLSSSVGHRLSTIGNAAGGTMTASAQATPSRQQSDALVNRIQSVVGGLGLSR